MSPSLVHSMLVIVAHYLTDFIGNMAEQLFHEKAAGVQFKIRQPGPKSLARMRTKAETDHEEILEAESVC